MANEIIIVYQDCALCGAKGKKRLEWFDSQGIAVRKVSFASKEGADYCSEAVFKHGIKTMPFYTDGLHYAQTAEDLLKLIQRKKSCKKNKTKQEPLDGISSEI